VTNIVQTLPGDRFSCALSIEVTRRLSFKDLFIFFGRRMHTCRISLYKWRCSSLMFCLDQWRSRQRARGQTDELREVRGHVYNWFRCGFAWGHEVMLFLCVVMKDSFARIRIVQVQVWETTVYIHTVGECIPPISCTNNSLLSQTTQPTSKYCPIRKNNTHLWQEYRVFSNSVQ
jgi:hypothetical protein